MKFKRIFSVVVLCIMLISLCSCSVGSGPSGLEKEILAGHSWGETQNQFNSMPKVETLFGGKVTHLGFSRSSNLGMYEIEYNIDSADYESIIKKVKSYCDTFEDKGPDDEYDTFIRVFSGYRDSIRISGRLDKDEDNESGYEIRIRMINDKYKDGF